MDYTDPRNRRLRDEPTLPLSPDEAVIAAQLYQEKVLQQLLGMLTLTGNTATRDFPQNDKHS